jgi:hypothetical protein
METLHQLENQLKSLLPLLEGEWVVRRSGYEADFAEAIGAELQKCRAWDCIWQGIRIELKKGGIWLDLVRYSEYLLQPSPESEVITLFMRYREQRITDIYAVTTAKLIKRLNLSDTSARDLLRISREVPRQLNAQASLTIKDIREIAEFHIH